ncbi:hypothetical protein [Thauera mechernichensis]
MTRPPASCTRGQALTEYLVALLVLAMLIGFGRAGDSSVVNTLLTAIHTAFNRLSAFISLPL